MENIMNACNKVVNYKPFSPNMANPGIKYPPDKARDKMKGMVHFNATRKRQLNVISKCNIRLYFLRKPIQTNTKKIRSKKSNWFYSHKYFNR